MKNSIIQPFNGIDDISVKMKVELRCTFGVITRQSNNCCRDSHSELCEFKADLNITQSAEGKEVINFQFM